jgi:hypothetical protein
MKLLHIGRKSQMKVFPKRLSRLYLEVDLIVKRVQTLSYCLYRYKKFLLVNDGFYGRVLSENEELESADIETTSISPFHSTYVATYSQANTKEIHISVNFLR